MTAVRVIPVVMHHGYQHIPRLSAPLVLPITLFPLSSSYQTRKAREVDPLRNLHAVRQFRLVPASLVVLQALHADHQHGRELFDRRQHLRVALAVASREKKPRDSTMSRSIARSPTCVRA